MARSFIPLQCVPLFAECSLSVVCFCVGVAGKLDIAGGRAHTSELLALLELDDKPYM